MAAAAAAGAGPAAGDSTLTWAFERLVDCPEVPVHVLTDMLLPVVATGLADLPDCTRARLCLRLVDSDLRESRVDETTLEYLRELAACDVAPHADPALVRPTPELMLQVGAACSGAPCRVPHQSCGGWLHLIHLLRGSCRRHPVLHVRRTLGRWGGGGGGGAGPPPPPPATTCSSQPLLAGQDGSSVGGLQPAVAGQ